MANTSVDFTTIDFDTNKANLKEFLRNHNLFRDYDYEGSNINLLLDLLSYNTTKNAFLINMGISESFLDTAKLRSSIVSHSKDLNYIPFSYRSAKATVSVTFEASGESQPYVIEKGSLFSTIIKNQAYTFSMADSLTVSSTSSNSESNNLIFEFETDIYEGFYVKDSYVYKSTTQLTPKFKITNPLVDISSLTVAIYEDNSETPTIFTRSDTILGLTSTSEVFFLQPVGNGYYEVLFGDNVFGRTPKINSTVVLDYRIASGSRANGARVFSMDFDPTNNGEMESYEITTVSNAINGAENQSVESIRTLAPRYFATQHRAVSDDDFESLILARYNNNISDVKVFGGEELEPKLYGRVVVSLKPASGVIASNTIKTTIEQYLRSLNAIPIRIIFRDPEYFYASVTTVVQYDTSITSKTDIEIKTIVKNAIDLFSEESLEKFGKDFRYSKFVATIDDSDMSITSNDTSIKLIKRIVPTLLESTDFNFSFNNELEPASGSVNSPVITSSAFTYVDSDNVQHPNSYIQDNGSGTLIVYKYVSSVFTIVNSNIGSVDHDTGEIIISDLKVSSYNTYIKIIAETLNKDIIMDQQNILIIDPVDVQVSAIGTIS